MTPDSNKILAIDIGGTHIKGTVLDSDGNYSQKYQKIETPSPSNPEKVMEVIKEIAAFFPEYDRIAAGFPGYVKDGVIKTAPKLGMDTWKDYPLANKLQEVLGKPALVINDADYQGLALATGKGLEMIITLGTGFGSALVEDGILCPHLEMSLHPFTKKKTYNDYIGEAALQKLGKKKWNKHLEKVLQVLKIVFNYDHLYISGGNSDYINFSLDDNISICGNKDGIKGGAVLWKQHEQKRQNNL
jgi:polyphosphate glucokinase